MCLQLAGYFEGWHLGATERQLVALYMAKHDKHIQQMAHPQLLLTYGGRATLAQAFSLVERFD